jgi:hypothetical protein
MVEKFFVRSVKIALSKNADFAILTFLHLTGFAFDHANVMCANVADTCFTTWS